MDELESSKKKKTRKAPHTQDSDPDTPLINPSSTLEATLEEEKKQPEEEEEEKYLSKKKQKLLMQKQQQSTKGKKTTTHSSGTTLKEQFRKLDKDE